MKIIGTHNLSVFVVERDDTTVLNQLCSLQFYHFKWIDIAKK